MKSRLSIGVVLFRDFELLDVFGPLEMFGLLPEHFELCILSQTGAIVESRQGPKTVVDFELPTDRQFDILLVPGGMGTRQEVDNPTILAWLRLQAAGAHFVTSVCTGSALLARSGLLDGRRATTNKAAFEWVSTQSEKVDWQKKARWVEDGKFFTASGVSAGIDMSLALIAKIHGQETSEQLALWSEYEWHQDPAWDPFAEIHGLV